MVIMKVIIEKAENQEKQFVIQCSEIDEEILEIKRLVESYGLRIEGKIENETVFIKLKDIYYFEYVDYNVYAYTKDMVCKISYSLDRLEELHSKKGFFRCSKAMIMNLDHVEKLKSIIGNKIVATLDNKEELIISRHYSKLLRAYLKAE